MICFSSGKFWGGQVPPSAQSFEFQPLCTLGRSVLSSQIPINLAGTFGDGDGGGLLARFAVGLTTAAVRRSDAVAVSLMFTAGEDKPAEASPSGRVSPIGVRWAPTVGLVNSCFGSVIDSSAKDVEPVPRGAEAGWGATGESNLGCPCAAACAAGDAGFGGAPGGGLACGGAGVEAEACWPSCLDIAVITGLSSRGMGPTGEAIGDESGVASAREVKQTRSGQNRVGR